MISVRNLTKTYMKTEKFTAVNNISFEINQGEIVGILGSNGAGKSTTIKMLSGLVLPDSGEIEMFGLNTSKSSDLKKILEKSSFLLEGQRSIYYYFTLIENIDYFLALKGMSLKSKRKHVDELIEFFGLKGEEHTVVSSFSTGMKQKASILIALSGDEEFIVLDEPTLGLDVHSSNQMVDLLKQYVQLKNKTVLITSHNMNVIENLCSRVIIMDKGSIMLNDDIMILRSLFGIQHLEIICKHIDEQYLKEYDYEIKSDCYKLLVNLKHEKLSQVIQHLEKHHAEIISIKSDNSNFENTYINLLDYKKEERAI